VQQGCYVGCVLFVHLALSLMVLVYHSSLGTCSFSNYDLGIYKDHPVFMKCLPIPIRMDSLHQRSSNCVDSYCHLFAFSMFVNVQLDIVSAAPNLMLLDVLIISMSSVTYLCFVKYKYFCCVDQIVTCGAACLVVSPFKLKKLVPNKSLAFLCL